MCLSGIRISEGRELRKEESIVVSKNLEIEVMPSYSDSTLENGLA